MKIQPISADARQTSRVQTFTTGNNTDARARALEAFNDPVKVSAVVQTLNAQPLSNQYPVTNPNKVQAEELSAIQQPRQTTITEEESSQSAAVAESEQSSPAEESSTSRRFAELAKQEKIARQRRIQLQRREQDLKEKEQRFAQQNQKPPETDYSNYISKDRFKEDPLGTFTEMGLSYDDLTNALLNTPQRDPRIDAVIRQQEAKIKDIEAKLDQQQKTYQEGQTQAYQQAVKQIELDVRSLVKNDPQFEVIRATSSVKDVIELITRTYERDGIILSNEDACTQVENYLVQEATKLTRLQKIKNHLQASAKKLDSQVARTPSANQPKPQQRTLTNAVGTSSRPITARERAIAAFKGENT